MPIELKKVIPWGRSFEEYVDMFDLSGHDLRKKILGCGDGPASFNAQATKKGISIVSVDPLYSFEAREIKERIESAAETLRPQLIENRAQYRWNRFRDVDELICFRMSTMDMFLEDYEAGRLEARYVSGELPTLDFTDKKFDLCLISFFLFAFEGLGCDFHLNSIRELLRVSREVRIFPVVDLNGNRAGYFDKLLQLLKSEGVLAELLATRYDVQIGAEQYLRLTQKEHGGIEA